MKSRKRYFIAGFSALAMLLLILDTKTALYGTSSAIQLCIRTVIPSLFPFFVVSSLLTGTLAGHTIPALRPLCALLGVPKGGESLLLIGLLGGYPVGARCIADACGCHAISQEDAQRMLGFCSNAGPAFLFGMAGQLFDSVRICWVLWGIHILSALAVGLILPKNPAGTAAPVSACVSLPSALRQGVRSMAEVCGWVVLFRVVIVFCQRWFLWLLPQPAQILFIGLLELSNGCISLALLPNHGLRFLLLSLFLSVGGVCVGMQTVSVTHPLGTGKYFRGKLLQGMLSILAALVLQPVLFSEGQRLSVHAGWLAAAASGAVLLTIFLGKREKSSRNLKAVPV